MPRRPHEPDAPESWILSRDAVRRIDQLAVERYAIPSIVLMENAAIGLARIARRMLARLGADRALILAGPGNNGGDGFALARHLHNAHLHPTVLLAADPDRYAGDAAANLAIIRGMRLPIDRLDARAGAETLEQAAANPPLLIVDALLGTGLTDAARGPIRDAILHVNRLRQPGVEVLAVDVPSGLDCDTGQPAGAGPAIEADATVSFVALKQGFLRLGAQRWTGDLHVAGIGAPRELLEELGQPVPDTRPGAEPTSPHTATPPEPPTEHGRSAKGPHTRGG